MDANHQAIARIARHHQVRVVGAALAIAALAVFSIPAGAADGVKGFTKRETPVIRGPNTIEADSGLVELSAELPEQGSAIWRIDYPPGIRTASSDDGTRFYFGSTCQLQGQTIYVSCVIVDWASQTLTQDIHEIRIGEADPVDPIDPVDPVDPVDPDPIPDGKFGFNRMAPFLRDPQLVDQLKPMAATFRETCDWAKSEISRRAGLGLTPISPQDVLGKLAKLQREDFRLKRPDWKEVFDEMTRIHEDARGRGKIKNGDDYADAYCEIAEVMEAVAN